MRDERVAADAGRSIAGCLMQGESVDQEWGSDNDIRTILTGVMVSSDDRLANFEDNKTYILQPTPIVGNQNEPFDPVQMLETEVNPLLEKCRNKNNVIFCIPVNCGNAHWRLFAITISRGEIVEAALHESTNQEVDDLKADPAYINAQAVVNNLNKNKKVMVDAVVSKKQTNGYSCMDYTIQTALNYCPNYSNTFAAIKKADSSVLLRQAVVSRILEVKKQKMEGVIFRPEDKNIINRIFSIKNSELFSKELSELKGDARNIQIAFDGMIAEGLSKGLKFGVARANALENMRRIGQEELPTFTRSPRQSGG